MIHLCKGYALTPPKSARGKVVPIIPQLGTVVHRYLEATENIIPNPYNLIFRTREGMPLAALDDRAGFRDNMRRAGHTRLREPVRVLMPQLLSYRSCST